MSLSISDFTTRLIESGLVLDADLRDWLATLPSDRQPADAEQLARELVQQKKLTRYQAEQISAGAGASLTLGNYVILDKLGQGGMGMVLKAEHKRMGRVVALKVMAPAAMKSPDAVKRFQREVQAAARLEHPNIVTAYDADEANGTHFLVMQFVDGTDLSALVKKNGPLRADQAVKCIIQAARGLEYAHEQGVIHRDIKPANLLIDKKGTVKILDMGLARIDDSVGGSSEGAGLTSTGTIMGTVDYMSPEQAMDTKHADARSDIYSLGCSLYYLLTGKVVYDGDTMMKKLMAHQNAPLPDLDHPGDETGTTALSTQTSSLNITFRRMVAKKPEDRPQSMTDVIAELERCFSGNSPTVAFERSGSVTNVTTSAGPGSGADLRSVGGAPATATALRASGTDVVASSAESETMISSADDAGTDPHTEQILLVERSRRLVSGQKKKSRTVMLGAIAGVAMVVMLAVVLMYVSTNTPEKSTDGAGSSLVNTSNSGTSDATRGGAANSRLTTVPTGEVIDVLARVDLARDTLKGNELGEWTREGTSLVTPAGFKSGRLVLPFAPPPEYELTAVVERMFGTDGIMFGTVVDGRPATVGFDIFDPRSTGISAIDFKTHPENESKFAEAVLGDRNRHTIRITVGKRSIGATVDDRQVIQWEGDPQRLTCFEVKGQAGNVWFGSGSDQFKFHKLELRPLNGAAKTPQTPALATAPFDAKAARAHQEAWANYLGTTVETTNSVGQTMVLIPPGEFLMGSTNKQIEEALIAAREINAALGAIDRIQKVERPQHTVVIPKPFLMSATEVTIGQFKKFSATGFVTEAEKDANNNPKAQTYLNPGFSVTDDSPAAGLTWNDANAFCKWLSIQEKKTIRLPTEAEWEYACRAGTTTQYSFGDNYNELPQYAWFNTNAGGSSHAAGSLLPNHFGLFDMHGNLFEWCGDWYDESWYEQSPRIDPKGPATGTERVLRSGRWGTSGTDCRSAYRHFRLPSNRYNGNGFRCVAELSVPAVASNAAPPNAAAWTDWLGPKLKRGDFDSNNDGWVREGDAVTTDRVITSTRVFPAGTRDGALRITYLLRDSVGIRINARDRKTDNTDATREVYVAEDNGSKLQIELYQGGKPKSLVEQAIPDSIPKDAPRTLEFRVVGGTLTATINGLLVATATDATVPEGDFAIVALKGLLIQKVEYQLLDSPG